MQTYATMENDWLTIGEAAKYLRVSPDTLRRWEKRKILRPHRSPTGWRYYEKKQLDYVFVQKPAFAETKESLITPQKEKPRGKIFKSKNLLIILTFLLSVYIVLLIFFLLQPIFQGPLSPIP